MTKLCVNCKHVVFPKEHDNREVSKCGANRPISLVTGLEVPDDKLPYCAVQRLNHEPCKAFGELWKAADHVMTPEEEEELMQGMPHV
jgi:hypothetical protein